MKYSASILMDHT